MEKMKKIRKQDWRYSDPKARNGPNNSSKNSSKNDSKKLIRKDSSKNSSKKIIERIGQKIHQKTLTAVFFETGAMPTPLNREIWPIVVEGVHFNHT